MSTKSKTLAKSLHTVSALVSVARHLDRQTAVEGVQQALAILGYTDATDTYALAARAVAILEAGK